jgi:hypothetical protein
MTQLAPNPSDACHVETNSVSEQVEQNRSRCHCQRPVSTNSTSGQPHSLVACTVLQMQGAEQPSRGPLTLFALNSPDAIREYAIGCDADVGGTSTAHFEYDADRARAPLGKPGAARFHGVMRLAVRPGYEQSIRGGYAGFRNKVRASVYLTQARTLTLLAARSSARRCLASSQTTCRTTASSRCACAPQAIRARAVPTLSIYRRRARRTTTCGNTASTLRARTAAGKTFLFVSVLCPLV